MICDRKRNRRCVWWEWSSMCGVGRESVLKSHIEQSDGLGQACLSWPVESAQCRKLWCTLLVYQWPVNGRDHLLQPKLVRLFLGVDELEKQFLTEIKLMTLLARFCLTLFWEKTSWGRTGKLTMMCIWSHPIYRESSWASENLNDLPRPVASRDLDSKV